LNENRLNRIPLSRPTVLGSELDYVAQSLEQGQLAGDGKFTRLCHGLIEQITGSPKALLTHSCTGALEMMGLLIDLKPGDEVILPSFTFVSTANAIVLRGATPVFVDIEPGTLTIDPAAAAVAVTPRTRAITAVHYAGIAADIDPLREITDRHGLVLFEDAAQAVGSTYRGRPCGSLGDLGAISFHETKNVVSGEGGALTINDLRFAERAEIVREKGTNRAKFLRGEIDKYTWVDVGSSYLPSEIIAAFLYAQLQRIDQINAVRRGIFDRYMDGFRHLVPQGRITLPTVPADRQSNGHIFYMLMHDAEDRDCFIGHMRQHAVSSTFHYVPLHDAPAGLRFGRTSGDLVHTRQTYERLVRLPNFHELGDGVDRVIDAALAYFD
jgi:dTDP-4-amino-4,6-dideoxygalactose transaminase